MKNNRTLFTFLFVMAIFLSFIFIYKPVENSIKPQTDKFVLRMFNSQTASVSELPLNDSLAKLFPQTFIFLASTENKRLSALMLYTLPRVVSGFDSMLAIVPHGNVTNLKINEKTYGLTSKHIFGEDIELLDLMKEAGFNANETKDLIVTSLKNAGQTTINAELFDYLEPNELEGSKCIIKAVNCYGGNNLPYQYEIKGTLHYLSPSEKLYLEQTATTSTGEKLIPVASEELYYVRVPNNLSGKVFGMSGASVIVTVKGKDYFLGMNTQRLSLAIKNATDTLWGTFMAIQPIVKSDIIK